MECYLVFTTSLQLGCPLFVNRNINRNISGQRQGREYFIPTKLLATRLQLLMNCSLSPNVNVDLTILGVLL